MTNLDFLHQDAVTVAQQLLGWRFYKQEAEGLAGGIIVETEAYTQADAASHTFKGETARNKSMFGAAGHLYVYFTYGMHYCANIVTGQPGVGQGVLLRALVPDEGLAIIRSRRDNRPDAELTNGPAKICQALDINLSSNGAKLQGGDFLLLEPNRTVTIDAPSQRIGIKNNCTALWRFTAQV